MDVEILDFVKTGNFYELQVNQVWSNKNNIEYIESIDKNEDETPRLIKLENYQGLVVTLVLDLGYFVESIIIRLGTVQKRNVKLCISKQRINHCH
ncbi:MAG: hypothetical protein K1X55_11865 [Chitinophagales bacterium]|nr:hypothetical protein [Chitinophagales bacterium]